MTEPRESLFDAALARHDREATRKLAWEGTFREYVELVESRPWLARNAFQRLVDMLDFFGSEPSRERGAKRRWKLFDDPLGEGRDAVFGLDRSIDELVDTLRAAARGLGPERRVILLHGPVGSAKSTIVRLLKRGLEHHSRTDDGALYTFDWEIDGQRFPSPMRQEPLLLLPRDMRADLERGLQRRNDRDWNLRIEGELDPVSRHYMTELLRRHCGDWSRAIEHVRVRRVLLSEEDRVGIGTFQPKDEKNQDSTELTGDVNYRQLAEFGADSDPRAFNFDGEFNVANRGLLEFIEVLKLDVAFLYDLLGASQEHAIKPRKFAQTSIDEVILGHTNEPEYRKLASNELMEAFRDRTIKIDVPYNLAVSDEVRIYERQFARPKLRGRVLAPHALEMAALWAVMTRIEEPRASSLTLVRKARLYDGGTVAGFGPEHVAELRRAAVREGLSGVSPRYVQDRIAAALVAERPTATALDILASIEAGLAHSSLVSNEDTRKRYAQLVGQVREEYERIAREEVQAAIASDREALDRLCAKYVENVRAYTSREKVLDATGRAYDPDERLMRSIEERLDIADARRDDFRIELMNFVLQLQRDGRTFEWRTNRRLLSALEQKVFEDRRDTLQLTAADASVVDPDAREKLAVLRSRLMRQFGYDELAADEVLAQVSSLFARGPAIGGRAEAA
jgi:serine protein kinase